MNWLYFLDSGLLMTGKLWNFFRSSCLLVIRVELPFRGQHPLPDDVPHDIVADGEQLGELGVQVVEAVQQHLQHQPLLHPVTIRVESLEMLSCHWVC